MPWELIKHTLGGSARGLGMDWTGIFGAGRGGEVKTMLLFPTPKSLKDVKPHVDEFVERMLNAMGSGIERGAVVVAAHFIGEPPAGSGTSMLLLDWKPRFGAAYMEVEGV